MGRGWTFSPSIYIMKDIGNLNNKEFGVQLDPSNNLKLVEDEDKGQKAYYKNKPMKYMDYMQEVSDRIVRNKQGKGADNLGSFSGFGVGTLKKPFEE